MIPFFTSSRLRLTVTRSLHVYVQVHVHVHVCSDTHHGDIHLIVHCMLLVTVGIVFFRPTQLALVWTLLAHAIIPLHKITHVCSSH